MPDRLLAGGSRVVGVAVLAATPRRVAWAWAGFFAFALVAFPLFDAVNGMPEEFRPLDIRFFYGPDEIALALGELDSAGRNAYLRSLLIADLAWPAIYGWTLMITTAWGFDEHPWQARLTWLPLVAVLFDLIENLSISVLILRWPGVQRSAAIGTSMASATKWVFAGSAFLVALAALARRLPRRRPGGPDA